MDFRGSVSVLKIENNGRFADWLCQTTSAIKSFTRAAEEGLTGLALLVMVALPIVEVVGRALIGATIPGSIDYVRHLTLWVTFLGAGIAAKQQKHLALGFAGFLKGRQREVASMIAGAVATVVALVLAWASLELLQADHGAATKLGAFIPQWVAEIIMPIGFALIGARLLTHMPVGWGRFVAFAAILLAFALGYWPGDARSPLLFPGFGIVLVAALAGAPIFVILGAIASLLFFVDAVPLASIPAEAYRIGSNPILPTIPLFTLAGTILAAGKASDRLARLFQVLVGWVPGGTAVATVTVCAFFTTFNGGSGVTILALGGLMLPILLRQGYRERFSIGALTSSGSLGILLPPSLLIILYGVSAHTPLDRLFLAGMVPGFLLIVMFSIYAVYNGRRLQGERRRFNVHEALAVIWEAKWEVLLPIGVLFGIFSGYATLVEVAALVAAYALVLEFLVHRELSLQRDLSRLLIDAATMIGGIMIILACAMGLTSYLIYADVPTQATAWVQAGIESRWVFLLALNLFLLIAGFLVDIFSAIVVIVPLILPVALAFGVDPVHLGIIFLANMELGYLTPPVGLNLFLASFRFERPLMEIWVASVPFFLIALAGVLIITFVPALSIGVVEFFGL
jgi:tripartite ATP-independent transporter DctM subunit